MGVPLARVSHSPVNYVSVVTSVIGANQGDKLMLAMPFRLCPYACTTASVASADDLHEEILAQC